MRDNYIDLYFSEITSGRITVGKWILAIYKIIVEGIESGRWRYDEDKAHRAIKFIENYCHHSEGRNDLLKLELWQKSLVSVVFGIVDKNGFRQFREVFVIVARKNGKTLFAAAIIAYMTYIDGEYGAKVYCLAPKLEQADLVYDAFYQIVQSDETLSEPGFTKKRRSDIYIEELNTSIKRLAFNSKKSDGFNPHLVICDEIEAWAGEQGLKQYEVMKSALGARKQPLIFSICTAGYVSDSIFDDLFTRSTAFLKGGDECRLLPFIYMIDDVEKWNDINELKKSNPNLGVSVHEDFYIEEIKVAKSRPSKKAEFLTKYCNIKQNSSVAWLEYNDVEKACKEELKIEEFADCYCLIGIDLSQTTDLTATSWLIEKQGEFYIFTDYYMPSNKVEELSEKEKVPYNIYVEKGWLKTAGENFVDYKKVYDDICEKVRELKFLPVKIGYDRYSAQYLIQDLEQSGLQTDDVYQGTNLSPLMKEFEGLLMDGKIHIGKNPISKLHLLNVAAQTDAKTGRIKPVKIQANMHIDGFVSMIDAFTVRSKYYNEIGEMIKNEGE